MHKFTWLIIGVVFTTSLTFSQEVSPQNNADADLKRIEEVYNYIKELYVDSVDTRNLSETAVRAMLHELDPHSVYIPKEQVARANESIKGSFVGVGIRFNILEDTLLVVNPIPGGPSQKVGIMAGDKILTVDGENIAGIGLTNSGVKDRLLGDKGTKVKVTILRGKNKELYFTITRDKIPLHSVISSYMVDDKIGYIKLNSFSRTTPREIDEAIRLLKEKGMEDLILDLQGNGGGLLYSAKYVADEFLDGNKTIVYSKGRKQPKIVLKANNDGRFEEGRLVILINENTASASEIVTGAVQDWDRGLVVGRRSFGKGLVQRPIQLSDGAQMRLTIAKYYTPSGRWIQKPYADFQAYRNDYMHRYKHGEMFHRDSIHLPDSLIHYTLIKKRPVRGGGGIMPDIFIPLDTMEFSPYYKDLSRSGVFNSFTLEYVNDHREELKENYPTVEEFKKDFQMTEEFMEQFFEFAASEDSSLVFDSEDYEVSKKLIQTRIKAMIAQDLWEFGVFYRIFNTENEIFMGGYNALINGTYKKANLAH